MKKKEKEEEGGGGGEEEEALAWTLLSRKTLYFSHE